MKKNLLFIPIMFITLVAAHAQVEYKIITSVESIVSDGLGRSRLISSNDARNFKDFTSTQTEEDNSRNKADRGDMRVKGFDETKLLNFYNLGGIRFQNIATNDALVTSKINALTEEGWELAFVNSGVDSGGDNDDSTGIFITRYIFKRAKK